MSPMWLFSLRSLSSTRCPLIRTAARSAWCWHAAAYIGAGRTAYIARSSRRPCWNGQTQTRPIRAAADGHVTHGTTEACPGIRRVARPVRLPWSTGDVVLGMHVARWVDAVCLFMRASQWVSFAQISFLYWTGFVTCVLHLGHGVRPVSWSSFCMHLYRIASIAMRNNFYAGQIPWHLSFFAYVRCTLAFPQRIMSAHQS